MRFLMPEKSQLPTPNSQNTPQPQPPTPGGAREAKPYDLRERTLLFALRILDITAALPESPEGRVVRQQRARAGTSIGANVEEADGAISKADKRKSLTVARKECREVRYWLRIIERRWNALVAADVVESGELINILSTMITKLS